MPCAARSTVRSPFARTRSTAASMASAGRGRAQPSRRSIAIERIAPIGFATSFPASVGAERADEGAGEVGEDVSEEVLRQEDVEAGGGQDERHRAGVDVLVLEANRRVPGGDVLDDAAPEDRRLQDVRLVDGGDEAAAPFGGAEGELGNSLDLLARVGSVFTARPAARSRERGSADQVLGRLDADPVEGASGPQDAEGGPRHLGADPVTREDDDAQRHGSLDPPAVAGHVAQLVVLGRPREGESRSGVGASGLRGAARTSPRPSGRRTAAPGRPSARCGLRWRRSGPGRRPQAREGGACRTPAGSSPRGRGGAPRRAASARWAGVSPCARPTLSRRASRP